MAKIKHAPGDTGAECGAEFRFPEEMAVTLDEAVTCKPCRAAVITRGECPECGAEKTLVWGWAMTNTSGVVDGRLCLNEVRPVFYLGCEYCSETVVPSVDPDRVVEALTKQGWRP